MIPSWFYNNYDELVFPDKYSFVQYAYFQDWLDFIISGSLPDHNTLTCKDMCACAIMALETGNHVEIIQAIIDALDTKLQDPSLNNIVGTFPVELERCNAGPPKWEEPKYSKHEITQKLLEVRSLTRCARYLDKKNGTSSVSVTVTPYFFFRLTGDHFSTRYTYSRF